MKRIAQAVATVFIIAIILALLESCSVDRITEVSVQGDSISVILPSRVDTVFVTDTVFVFCNDPQLVECE